jgi:tRNA-guanine family transglycosylase
MLQFGIITKCSVTLTRVSRIQLLHGSADTQIFMPVGTKGTMKGVTDFRFDSEPIGLCGN